MPTAEQIRQSVADIAATRMEMSLEKWQDVSSVLLGAADEIDNLRSKLVALRCFAGTLAVHVNGHFALPTKESESICKSWAAIVQSEPV